MIGAWNRTAFGCGFCLSAAISVVGFLPNHSHAQGEPEPELVIQKMDTDGDGRVSQDEWLRPPRVFRRIDRNGDGFVTVEELGSFTRMRSLGGAGSATGTDGNFRPERNRPGTAPAVSMPEQETIGFEIIDTHVHFGAGPAQRDFDAGVAEALSKMPQRHVAMAIIIPTPQVGHGENRYDYKELRRVSRSDRLRVAGGSGVLGRMLYGPENVSADEKKTFRGLAQSLVDEGIVAFGEIGLYHYAIPQIGNRFGHVPLNHPLLDVLGDVAAKSDIPIDVHFDVVPKDTDLPRQLQGADNPEHLEANLREFQQFLSRNRKAKIVWAHVGLEATPFRTAQLCANLLRRHENLFMSIRLMRGAPKPSAAMDQNGRLKDEWKQLFTTFPNRFVFGSESMYGSSMSAMFDNQFVLYQKLLSQLPPNVARKIASENALKIYSLSSEEH